MECPSPPRCRSRSPVSFKTEEISINNDVSEKVEDLSEPVPEDNPQRVVKHQVRLSNIPGTWFPAKVKKFIISTVNSKHVTDSLMLVFTRKKKFPNEPSFSIAQFSNKEAAEEACEQLQDVEIDGKKLSPKMSIYIKKTGQNEKPKQFDQNQQNLQCENIIFGPGRHQRCGLSHRFLQSLGIKKLASRIAVTKLPPEADEAKIKEVFSLAGNIVEVNFLENMAIITYDHVVEAVQAISMFHGRKLFGAEIKVVMYTRKKDAHNEILPKGLEDIGPGLGENGRPLNYVRPLVEIEKIKYEIREWMAAMSDPQGNTYSRRNPYGNQNVHSGNQEVQTMLKGLLQQSNLISALSGVQNSLQSGSFDTGNQVDMGANNTAQMSIIQNFLQNLANEQTQQNASSYQGSRNEKFQRPYNKFKNVKCFHCKMPGHRIEQCRLRTNDGQFRPNLSPWSKEQPGRHMSQQNNGPSKMSMQSNMSIPNNILPIPNNLQSLLSNMTMPNNMAGNTTFLNNMAVPGMAMSSNMSMSNNSQRSNNDDVDKYRNSSAERDDPHLEFESDMVVFKNLPSSVSIESIISKMKDVGEVKFAEMMARGKAIVRFRSQRHAAKCISMYHKSRVDGQTITVQYI